METNKSKKIGIKYSKNKSFNKLNIKNN